MYTLALEDLKLQLYLGVTAAERAKQQTVLVQIEIDFATPPLACETGKLSDTICYATLTEQITKFCAKRHFTLIETLGMQLFLLVKTQLPNNNKLKLRVVKQAPLPNLARSVFTITT